MTFKTIHDAISAVMQIILLPSLNQFLNNLMVKHQCWFMGLLGLVKLGAARN